MKHTREIRLVPRPTALEPFKLLLAFMCVVSGIPLALHGAAPTTVQAALPPWLVLLWGCELALGGLLTLGGTLGGAWWIERTGLAFLGAASTVYGLILLFTAWPAGALVASIILGLGVACYVSIWLARRLPVIVRVRARSTDGDPT